MQGGHCARAAAPFCVTGRRNARAVALLLLPALAIRAPRPSQTGVAP